MTGRAIVHLTAGPQAFQKAVLSPGTCCIVGASEQAAFQLLHDQSVGASEVELCLDGTSCAVRVLPPDAPFLLNGQSIPEGRLEHSQWFRFGESTFLFCLERHTPPRVWAAASRIPLFSAVLETLGGAHENLYAVLDAAKDERILELLRESVDETRSLYEGIKGDTLAEAAPYLVKLNPHSFLLEALVSEGWGKSWGIYLNCPLPFKEVRRHLRRILWVQQEAAESLLYFRFYDPRVLRVFVPTCTLEQLAQLYGPIGDCWVEDENGGLLHFHRP